MATLIWFIVWWVHGFPNIIDQWNPWLIWLIICFVIFDGGMGAGYSHSRHD